MKTEKKVKAKPYMPMEVITLAAIGMIFLTVWVDWNMPTKMYSKATLQMEPKTARVSIGFLRELFSRDNGTSSKKSGDV